MILNNSPTAVTTLGFKHKPGFGLNRLGSLNPIPTPKIEGDGDIVVPISLLR